MQNGIGVLSTGKCSAAKSPDGPYLSTHCCNWQYKPLLSRSFTATSDMLFSSSRNQLSHTNITAYPFTFSASFIHHQVTKQLICSFPVSQEPSAAHWTKENLSPVKAIKTQRFHEVYFIFLKTDTWILLALPETMLLST